METDPRLARFYKDVTPRKRLRTAVDFVRTCGDAAHECEFLTENAWRIIETCFETVEQYERMTSGEWEQDAPKARPIAFAKRVLRGEKVIEERDWSDVFFLVRRVIEASAAAGARDEMDEAMAADALAASAAPRRSGDGDEPAADEPAADGPAASDGGDDDPLPTRATVGDRLRRASGGLFSFGSNVKKKVLSLSPSARILLLCRKVLHPDAATAARLEGVRLLLQLAEGLLERAAASWCVGGSAAEQVRCTELLEAALGGERAEAAEWADGEASAAAFAGHRWTGQKTPAETRLALVEEFLKYSLGSSLPARAADDRAARRASGQAGRGGDRASSLRAGYGDSVLSPGASKDGEAPAARAAADARRRRRFDHWADVVADLLPTWLGAVDEGDGLKVVLAAHGWLRQVLGDSLLADAAGSRFAPLLRAPLEALAAAAGPGGDADAGVEEDSAFGDACVETVELFRTFAADARRVPGGAALSDGQKRDGVLAHATLALDGAYAPGVAARLAPHGRRTLAALALGLAEDAAVVLAARDGDGDGGDARWAALRDKVRRVVDVYVGAAVHRRGCPLALAATAPLAVRCAFRVLLARPGPESRDWCARWAANLASDGAGVDPDAAAPDDDDVAVRETLGGHVCAEWRRRVEAAAAEASGALGAGREASDALALVDAALRLLPPACLRGAPPAAAEAAAAGAAGAARLLASRPKARDPKAAPRTGGALDPARVVGALAAVAPWLVALADDGRAGRGAAAGAALGALCDGLAAGSPWPRAARPLRRRVIGLVVAAVGRELDRGGAARGRAPLVAVARRAAALAAVSRRLVAPAVAAAAACALDDAPGAAWARGDACAACAAAYAAAAAADGPDAPDLGAKIGGAVAACARDAVRGADAALLARALSSAASVVRVALAPAAAATDAAQAKALGLAVAICGAGAAAARDDAGGLGEVGEAAAARRKACRGVAIAALADASGFARELLELGAEGAAVVAVLLRCVLANGAAALARALEDLPGDAPGGLEFERGSSSASRPRDASRAGLGKCDDCAAAGLRALGAWLPLRDASGLWEPLERRAALAVLDAALLGLGGRAARARLPLNDFALHGALDEARRNAEDGGPDAEALDALAAALDDVHDARAAAATLCLRDERRAALVGALWDGLRAAAAEARDALESLHAGPRPPPRAAAAAAAPRTVCLLAQRGDAGGPRYVVALAAAPGEDDAVALGRASTAASRRWTARLAAAAAAERARTPPRRAPPPPSFAAILDGAADPPSPPSATSREARMEKFRRAVRMTMTKPDRTRHLSADLDLARDAEADGLIGDLFEGTDGGDGDGSPRGDFRDPRPAATLAREEIDFRADLARDRATAALGRLASAEGRAPPAGADAAPDATLVGPPAAGATFAVESNLDVLDLVLGDAGALLAFERFLDGEFAAEGLRFLAAAALHDGSRDDAARIVAAFVRADAASQVNLPQRIVADVERRLREDDLDGLFDDAVHECRALVANDNLQRFLDKAGADRGAALAPKRVRLVERLRTARQLARAKPVGASRPPPPSPSAADLRAAAAPRPDRPAARAPAAALLVHHLGLVAPALDNDGAVALAADVAHVAVAPEGLAAARAVEAAAARPPPVVLLDAPPGDAAFATFLRALDGLDGAAARFALPGDGAAAPDAVVLWEPRAPGAAARARAAADGAGAATPTLRVRDVGRGLYRLDAAGFPPATVPPLVDGVLCGADALPRAVADLAAGLRAPRPGLALGALDAPREPSDPPVSVYAALVQREAPRPVAVIPPGKAV